MRYSDERKDAVLKKLMPPRNRAIAELAEEEAISVATLYNWRRQAREQGRLLPEGSTEPGGWSSRDKFNAVLESAALSRPPDSFSGARDSGVPVPAAPLRAPRVLVLRLAATR